MAAFANPTVLQVHVFENPAIRKPGIVDTQTITDDEGQQRTVKRSNLGLNDIPYGYGVSFQFFHTVDVIDPDTGEVTDKTYSFKVKIDAPTKEDTPENLNSCMEAKRLLMAIRRSDKDFQLPMLFGSDKAAINTAQFIERFSSLIKTVSPAKAS